MPRLVDETFGAGDQSWLGSTYGIHECRTETLDVTDFTAVDGSIQSGTPVAIVNKLAVPYNSAGADGSQILAGFLFTDQSVAAGGKVAVPVLDHGRVKVDRLPVAFTAPAATNVTGQFIFVTEGA